jgi:hypothetical protein
VNIFHLYSRAGTIPGPVPPGGKSALSEEPFAADFDMENAGLIPKLCRLVARLDIPEDWTVEFEDSAGHVWHDGELYTHTLMPDELWPIRMRVHYGDVYHGDQGYVKVVQYDEFYYPSEEGVMGGIDFPLHIDGYEPQVVDDLIATAILDSGGQPGTAPAVRLDFTPITTDTVGWPESVSYYEVWRDTSPNMASAARVAVINRDANPGLEGWQYYDTDVRIGPWYERDVEYYYTVWAYDEAGYPSGPSHVAGTGNVLDNGKIRATMNEFGGSGDRTDSGQVSSDIAWLSYMPGTQVYSWQGNLRYDDGRETSSHFLSPSAGAFEVLEAAHYVAGEVLSHVANDEFDVAIRHQLDGAGLMTELTVTNVSGHALSDVQLAWILDGDLVLSPDDPREPCCHNFPWLGFGFGRWFAAEGMGVQTNLNACAGVVPANIELVHTAKMDGDTPPSAWTVGNGSGFQGSSCAFNGVDAAQQMYEFETPFDNPTGCVGFDQDLAIVTDFVLNEWAAQEAHRFTFAVSFRRPGDIDASDVIDLSDYADFAECLDGPGSGPIDAGCETFDFYCDDDIDLADFQALQSIFGG